MGSERVLKIGREMEWLGELQPKADETAKKLYQDVSPSIVKVTTDSGQGSGFVVDKDGRIATDAHVVQDASEVKVTTPGGQHYRARIEKLDDINDLAVLKVEGRLPDKIKPLPLGSTDKLTADQPLWALGHPRGASRAYISPGYFRFKTTPLGFLTDHAGFQTLMELGERIARMTPKEAKDVQAYLDRPMVHGKVHIKPGSSGGPLLDVSGKVVGLSDWIEKDNPSNAYFTPVEKLSQLLKETDKEHKFDFSYTRTAESWANLYKAGWQELPIFTAASTGIGGFGLYKLATRLPRATTVGIGAYGALSLFDDGDQFLNSQDRRDKWKYGLASASDLVMTAGLLARLHPATRSLSLLTAGVGFIGRLGTDFIPNRLVLTDIRRKDGDPRPPFSGDL